MKKESVTLGTGRRKTAVARVFMRKGDGKIVVNNKKCEEYFVIPLQQDNVKAPLSLCKVQDTDFVITVRGGGLEGQSIAVRHALSRALVKKDEEQRAVLKEQGFLTRDPRKRERKKYGRAGARARFQFSKR